MNVAYVTQGGTGNIASVDSEWHDPDSRPCSSWVSANQATVLQQ